MLVTHRNLNLGLATLVTALAAFRAGRGAPTGGYLLAGVAGVRGMTYTAYLGGKMVYTDGVGVQKAGGVREGRSPAIGVRTAGRVAHVAGRAIAEGVANVARETREGEIAPAAGQSVR